MKNNVFLKCRKMMIVALATIPLCSHAQDTIVALDPPDNYLWECWMEGDTSVKYGTGYDYYGPHRFAAKEFLAPRTMTIYGIAAMLEGNIDEDPSSIFYCNKVYGDKADVKFAIYRKSMTVDTLVRVSPFLQTNYVDSVPSYYFRIDRELRELWKGQKDTYPVFEMYFDQPQTMEKGKFYLGREKKTGYVRYYREYMDEEGENDIIIMTFFDWGKNPGSHDGCEAYYERINDHPELGYPNEWYWVPDVVTNVSFFFPILTPKPEQPKPQEPADDTVGIAMVERGGVEVMLAPNPASQSVTIGCEVGMERVAVFDAAGRRVYTTEHPATRQEIDVHAWPAGLYIVEVHTDRGLAVRRLMVE